MICFIVLIFPMARDPALRACLVFFQKIDVRKKKNNNKNKLSLKWLKVFRKNKNTEPQVKFTFLIKKSIVIANIL